MDELKQLHTRINEMRTQPRQEENQFLLAQTRVRSKLAEYIPHIEITSEQEKIDLNYEKNIEIKVEEEDSEPVIFHLDLLDKPSNAIKFKSSAPDFQDMINQMIQNIKPSVFFLRNHNLNEQQRSRMVDWMIEIFEEYHSNQSTFCQAVQIMDQYCEQSNKRLEGSHLHLLGVTCIWLASKLNDVKILTINDIIQISHHKLQKNQYQIMQSEETILKTLNFEIDQPNLFNFISLYHLQIKIRLGVLHGQVDFQIILWLTFYLGRFIIFCYEILALFRKNEIAAGLIILSVKILKKQLHKNKEFFLPCLMEISQTNFQQLNYVTTKLKRSIIDFKEHFPHSLNIFKYNSNLNKDAEIGLKNLKK